MERLDVVMSFEDIVHLINLIDKSQISLMELNCENVYLKLDKSINRQLSDKKVLIEDDLSGKSNDVTDIVKQRIDEAKDNSDDSIVEYDDSDFAYILSPIVGTVYLSPSPGKQTYVCEKQSVSKGDVVCIIEAMKLMNEIESEYSGKIIEILVKDSQMVEYGQKLFKVKCD